MTQKISLFAALIAHLSLRRDFCGAGTGWNLSTVKAKGVGKNIATATKYAQDDLKQTAKSLKGKVTQASTNCGPVADGYKCKISAVVCPK